MDKVINELKFNSVSGNYETLFRKCRSLSSREKYEKKNERDKEKERENERKSGINTFHFTLPTIND